MNVAAPPYSPPVENPCTSRATISRIGAHMPIVAYVGSTPIAAVEHAIRMIVVASTRFESLGAHLADLRPRNRHRQPRPRRWVPSRSTLASRRLVQNQNHTGPPRVSATPAITSTTRAAPAWLAPTRRSASPSTTSTAATTATVVRGRSSRTGSASLRTGREYVSLVHVRFRLGQITGIAHPAPTADSSPGCRWAVLG